MLRAPFIPEAGWAIDCAEAILILWPVSARALVFTTLEEDAFESDTAGVIELLVPEVLAVSGELILLAEADCADASCGLLRAVFLPEADCAIDWAEAVVIF